MQANTPPSPSIWATVLTAVLVALAVGFAVGFFVKPLVDARWQRIQRHLHVRDALISTAIDLAVAGRYLTEPVPAGVKGPLREIFMTERRRNLDRMRTGVAGLLDGIGNNASAYHGPIRTLIIDYVTTMQGLMMSERTYLRKATLVGELSEQVVWVISPPPLWQVWHLPTRMRAVAKFRELLVVIGSEVPEPVPTPAPSMSPASA